MANYYPDAPPAGFTPLGKLASIPEADVYRLLVPRRTHDELEALKRASNGATRAQKGDAPTPEPNQPPQELKAEPVARESTRRRAKRVRIFASSELEKARQKISGGSAGLQKALKPLLDAAAKQDGFRALPSIRPALKRLEASLSRFANLREPLTKLQLDLALAQAMSAESFYVRPILLSGPPGVGKTHFAMQLAGALGVPMAQWSAGNAQAAFQLAGSDSHWSEAAPGLIFETMARSDSAAPVFVLDEVDKIGKNMNYPVLPVFLDLLERNTARVFQDAFFTLSFDASRILYVLTANDLSEVPAPILSRVEVFDIPPPEPSQRMQIIQAEVERLQGATRKRITLDASAAEALAERTDVDLRQTHRLVVDAFAAALIAKRGIAELKLPPRAKQSSIGFVGESMTQADCRGEAS